MTTRRVNCRSSTPTPAASLEANVSYLIEVFLSEIECIDTESLHSSDRALFHFAAATDLSTGAESLEAMRINSGETRLFRPHRLLFRGAADVPRLGLAIHGLDVDLNQGWDDSETARTVAVKGIGVLLKVLAAPTMAGFAWDAGMTAIQQGIGALIPLDTADTIFDSSKMYDVPGGAPYTRALRTIDARHNRVDPFGYSSSEYRVKLAVQTTWMPSFGRVEPIEADANDAMIRDFRHRAEVALAEGFIGAYPNGHRARKHVAHVGGTVFLNADASVLRHVSLSALGDPPSGDFGENMRAAQRYAVQNGFVGGFPTFKSYTVAREVVRHVSGAETDVKGVARGEVWQAIQTLDDLRRTASTGFGRGKGPFESGSSPWREYVEGRAAGDGPTTGVVLIKPTHAEFRDVPRAELGNLELDDHGARFRAAADYASRNGFLGALPTMFHADRDGATVIGLILLQHGAGEWRDVLLYMDPR